MLSLVTFEHLVSGAPAPVPMDDSETYDLGVVESSYKFIADRAVTVVREAPLVSTGGWSIGTNSPSFDNIVPFQAWGLINLSPGSARNVDRLAAGGPIVPVSEGQTIKLKVTKGILDSGGEASVYLVGYNDYQG